MRFLADSMARLGLVSLLRWVSTALLLVAGADCSTAYHCTERKDVCECVSGGVSGGLTTCSRTYQCCVEWRSISSLPDDPYSRAGCDCYNPKPGASCISPTDDANTERKTEVVSRPKTCPPALAFLAVYCLPVLARVC